MTMKGADTPAPVPAEIVAGEAATVDFSREMSYGDYLHLDELLGAQQLRSAYHQKDLAEGRKIAEKVVESFHTCPIPEIARLGRTLSIAGGGPVWSERFAPPRPRAHEKPRAAAPPGVFSSRPPPRVPAERARRP